MCNKSIIEKKKNITNILAKNKWNTIEVLISKDLINSDICFDEFVSVNNLFNKHEYMKKAIKNPKAFNSDNKYAWYNKKKFNLRKRVHWC